MVTIGANIGAQLRKFFNIAKATWIQVLGHNARTFSNRKHGHKQWLVVGRQTRIRQGLNINGAHATLRHNADSPRNCRNVQTHVVHPTQEHLHVVGASTTHNHIATRNCSCCKISGRLNAIGHDGMLHWLQ